MPVSESKRKSTKGPETRNQRARKEEDEAMAAAEDVEKAVAAKAIADLVESWTCPITYALLFDPVVAEDGKLYERAAIEEYLERKADQVTVKSPITNEEMG